jgi:enoyl-CoA hydratase/carnithine racemase
MDYTTITHESVAHVATVTLNRPDRLNSFNWRMAEELKDLWRRIRQDDDVHVVVLQAAGDRAFCTGMDVADGVDVPDNPWSQDDVGEWIGPKANGVWKPVVVALQGMVAGGAFYFVNESDVVICSDDAMFFDPHVNYGMVSALEPIGLTYRIPYAEVMRMVLLGLDERMSAARAHQVGLVSEVVTRDALRSRAAEIAAVIAAKPPAAVQGTVKAVWESLDLPRSAAMRMGLTNTVLGNPLGVAEVDRTGAHKPEWTLR